MIALVGYTGFVGSNIYAKGKIDKAYNSKNIAEAYGLKPDILIYAGLRAEKYLANKNPEADMETIKQAMKNIESISPKKLILISTIDVFKNPSGKDENSESDIHGLSAYGLNRYRLEEWARRQYSDSLIIRLPGLFGTNIKKNFIYDFMERIPFMLNAEKIRHLAKAEPELIKYYQLLDNGFYQVARLNNNEKRHLKEIFARLGFSALNFTDSRSRFQFYDLSRLWEDINIALKEDLRLWHAATEPISAGELYQYLTGEEFINELKGEPADYDYRTIFAEQFGGKDGYILKKDEVMKLIRKFIEERKDLL